jgi:hypothetical protein
MNSLALRFTRVRTNLKRYIEEKRFLSGETPLFHFKSRACPNYNIERLPEIRSKLLYGGQLGTLQFIVAVMNAFGIIVLPYMVATSCGTERQKSVFP